MKIIVHVGLHKTATTFLQRKLFSNLPDDVGYNPPAVMHLISAIFEFGFDVESRLEALNGLLGQLEKEHRWRVLLISSEHISQDMFRQNYGENIEKLSALFPSAAIILFFRDQANWLVSCYKESIKNRCYQSIEDFLNYKDGHFNPTNEKYNRAGMPVLDVYKSDWFSLGEQYENRFQACHFFRYEDLVSNPESVAGEIYRVLGCNLDWKAPAARDRENVGLSLPSIQLLISVNRFWSLFVPVHSCREHDEYRIKIESSRASLYKKEKLKLAYRISRLFRSLWHHYGLRRVLLMVDQRYKRRFSHSYISDRQRQMVGEIHDESNARVRSLKGFVDVDGVAVQD